VLLFWSSGDPGRMLGNESRRLRSGLLFWILGDSERMLREESRRWRFGLLLREKAFIGKGIEDA